MENSFNSTDKNRAENIYKKRFHQKLVSDDSLKDYYVKLRAAVIDEFETYGFCTLLDDFIESEELIDVVAYSAIIDIKANYPNNELTDVAGKKFVPYIISNDLYRSRIRWNECYNINTLKNTLKKSQKIVGIFREVREILRKAHIRLINENSKGNSVSEEIINKAEQEAQKIKSDAEENAERIVKQAEENAEKVVKQAEEKADEMKAGLLQDVEAKAKGISENLIENYLLEQQNRFKKELSVQMAEISEDTIEKSKRTALFHKEMCDNTKSFQAEWISTIDDMKRHMEKMKSDFYEHLSKWQRGLYPKSIESVAYCFTELYRIINVDKLIRKEVLFRYNSEKQTNIESNANTMAETCNTDVENESAEPSRDAEVAVENETAEFSQDAEVAVENESAEPLQDAAVVAEKESAEPSPDVLKGLESLNKSLSIFIRKFERALNDLDLYTYYPEVGDIFDVTEHSSYDEEDYVCEGRPIKECVIPGIRKKAFDEFGDDVLIAAVVKV